MSVVSTKHFVQCQWSLPNILSNVSGLYQSFCPMSVVSTKHSVQCQWSLPIILSNVSALYQSFCPMSVVTTNHSVQCQWSLPIILSNVSGHNQSFCPMSVVSTNHSVQCQWSLPIILSKAIKLTINWHHIIIIMVIFKCYFSRAHSPFFKKLCEHRIRKTNRLKALCMMQNHT